MFAIPWCVTAAFLAFLSLQYSDIDPDPITIPSRTSSPRRQQSPTNRQTAPISDSSEGEREDEEQLRNRILESNDGTFWLFVRCIFAYISPIMLLLVGFCPYIGIRTYSALSMFSNLRVEGCRSNHLFMPQLTSTLDDTIEVLNTDLRALTHFSIDLSDLYSNHTVAFLEGAGTIPALWICPPTWPGIISKYNFEKFKI